MIRLLRVDDIIRIHDAILAETGIGLPGLAGNKDLAGMLGRVANRIGYELHDDLLRIAAFYAVATGHCFNDGDKRTACGDGRVPAHERSGHRHGRRHLVEMMAQTAVGRLDHENLTEAGVDDHAAPAD